MAQTETGDGDPLAATTADAGPPRATIIARDVIVSNGESLRDIARRELGRAAFSPMLAEFNELDEAMPLEAGQIVRVPIHVPARGEVARVVFVKGRVTKNGDPLEADGTIETGDMVETGDDGFVSLEFESGSVVNLQPGSSSTLERLSCLEVDDSCVIEIDTLRGAMSSDVQSRDGQPSDFRIRTPYATAAVRGTEFDFLADPGRLRVAVTDGMVGISAVGETQDLEDGFGAVTREGEPPGPPLPLLPAPVFRNVPTRVAPGDAVLWWPLSDTERYSALLSLDAGGAETVADFAVSGNELDVAAPGDAGRIVAPGDYYLELRGIGEEDLPGRRSSTRVTVAAIDADLTAPDLEITRDDREFLVGVVDPAADAAGYEIQISDDENFVDPLAVDVGPTGSAVFRFDADRVYARARRLVDPRTVSAFGAAAVSE